MKQIFSFILWVTFASLAFAEGEGDGAGKAAGKTDATPSSNMNTWYDLSYQGDKLCAGSRKVPLKVYELQTANHTPTIGAVGLATDEGKPSPVPLDLNTGCVRVLQEIESDQLTDSLKAEIEEVTKTKVTSALFIRGASGDSNGSESPLKNNGKIYVTTRDRVGQADFRRYGFTYGVLVTPFKYYLGNKNGKKTIVTPQATIGAYVGTRIWDSPGFSGVFALSAGPVSTTVNLAAGGTEKVNGASFAIAELWEIKERFIIGFMLGKDFYSQVDNADNPLDNRLWFGVNLGAAL